MKPFDIELAKQGHPVCTRNGKPARIICWDRKSVYNIVALIVDDKLKENMIGYTDKGEICVARESGDDLMMATTKHEGWINLFRSKDGTHVHTGPYIFETENEAIYCSGDDEDYVTTTPISWEE